MKPIKIEIRKEEKLWLIVVDGIKTASSFFESRVRELVDDVVRLNPDVVFEIVGQ